MIRIGKRDIEVLETLDKMRVLNIELIMKLCGFENYGSCCNRLKKLYKHGYLKYYQESVSSKRYYSITQKGINYIYPATEKISKNGKMYKAQKKPPTINKRTLEHEIQIAYVLNTLLELNPELTINDFKTERNLQENLKYVERSTQHFCDLYCEKYNTKVEVELSVKSKKRLMKNIVSNSPNAVQIWIVDSELLYKRLSEEKNYLVDYVIEIVKIDELHECKRLKDLNRELYEKNDVLNLVEEKDHQMNIFEL